MTKFMDKSFSVALGGEEYREGWERIFAKTGETDDLAVLVDPAEGDDNVAPDYWEKLGKVVDALPLVPDDVDLPEPEEKPKRRPRGNWLLCDGKYWVSWGPQEHRPSTRTGFSVLVPTVPPHSEGYVVLKEPTADQLREIINAMGALLTSLGCHSSGNAEDGVLQGDV